MLKLSVSSMDTYKTCPKKYYYRYIERLKVEAKKHTFTEFGSCAHLILEYFHQRVDESTDENEYAKIMKKCFVEGIKEFDRDILDSDDIWSPDGSKNGIRYLKDLMQEYLHLVRKGGLPNVVATEKDYSFGVKDGALVRGFIDRIDKVGEGHYHVLDYKTSKNAKYLKKFQLLVYALAIKDMYPDAEKVTGSFMLIKHGFREETFSFTDLDLDKCFEDIKKNIDMIENEKVWVKKPTRLCHWCDYQSVCQNNWVGQE